MKTIKLRELLEQNDNAWSIGLIWLVSCNLVNEDHDNYLANDTNGIIDTGYCIDLEYSCFGDADAIKAHIAADEYGETWGLYDDTDDLDSVYVDEVRKIALFECIDDNESGYQAAISVSDPDALATYISKSTSNADKYAHIIKTYVK